jgi:23S rRNA-/tRNA-specific pseudouridylate synthase
LSNPLVLDIPVRIIYEDDDMVVVNKPSSYLVYPMSSTRLNSVAFTLKKEFGYDDLRAVHRLDRLTSGVLIFGKVGLKQELNSSETSCDKI